MDDARELRIGVQLPEVERVVRWPELVGMARAAEEVGFDSVWYGDHLLYRGDGRPERGPWEAWTVLSALAASTSRVELGPLVACAGFHPPGLLAKMAATIDEVSGGRFRLAVGAGWNPAEHEAFGIPMDARVDRFEEAFAILRPLVAGERVTLHGTHWRAEDAVLLPTPHRRVPLMIGSNGPRMLRIALPHVDWWNTWWDDHGNDHAGFARLNRRISRAAEDVGRDPAEVRRSTCAFVHLRGDLERPEVPEAPPLRGSPEQLAHALRAYAAAGADEVILVVSPSTEASVHELADVLDRVRRD